MKTLPCWPRWMQMAINPVDGAMVIIEMNPRVR